MCVFFGYFNRQIYDFDDNTNKKKINEVPKNFLFQVSANSSKISQFHFYINNWKNSTLNEIRLKIVSQFSDV